MTSLDQLKLRTMIICFESGNQVTIMIHQLGYAFCSSDKIVESDVQFCNWLYNKSQPMTLQIREGGGP